MDATAKLIYDLDVGLRAGLGPLFCFDNYYSGEQPLKYMSAAMREEMGDTVAELVINWARVVVDANENRLDVEDIRYPGDLGAERALREAWQANNMDEQSQLGHLDSISLARSYVTVGTNPESGKPPLITVESPFQMWARRNPATRRVSAAVKRWKDDDEIQHAIVYTPNWTREYVQKGGTWVHDKGMFEDEHDFGIVPVVPLPNRPRTMRPDGTSELVDVIPLADAANKMATDMMVSGEYHAMPRRWAFGLKQSDFVDAQGNPLSTWSKVKSRLWANENPDIKVGQFQESDLANFHNTIKLLAQMTAQLAALPPHYLGFTGDNPASADAIRAAESQLVKRIERKHTFLGGAWEDVARLTLMFINNNSNLPPHASGIEIAWRDPATPTVAQKADAAVKKYASGIIPLEQTRIDLGYTEKERAQMRKFDAADAARDPVAQMAAKLPAKIPPNNLPSTPSENDA